MTLLLIFIFFSLLLSAFFSGTEIAFVSANKLGVEVMRNKGETKGKLLAKFYEEPKKFIVAMLIGNNIALVAFTILIQRLLEPSLTQFMSEDSMLFLLIVTMVVTIVVLVFGEYLPKTIFKLYSNELLYRLSYVIRFFEWLLTVPTWIMTALSSFLLRFLFNASDERMKNVFTTVDLEHFINTTEEESIDKEILTNALNLKQVKVRDCMIPRNEIIHVDKKSSIEELEEKFKESRLSRIIVVDGDIENCLLYTSPSPRDA